MRKPKDLHFSAILAKDIKEVVIFGRDFRTEGVEFGIGEAGRSAQSARKTSDSSARNLQVEREKLYFYPAYLPSGYGGIVAAFGTSKVRLRD